MPQNQRRSGLVGADLGVQCSNAETVKWLLSLGDKCDMTRANKKGKTPYALAQESELDSVLTVRRLPFVALPRPFLTQPHASTQSSQSNRDSVHSFACTGTGLDAATSAPGLGPTAATSAPGLGLIPATSAPGLGPCSAERIRHAESTNAAHTEPRITKQAQPCRIPREFIAQALAHLAPKSGGSAAKAPAKAPPPPARSRGPAARFCCCFGATSDAAGSEVELQPPAARA